MKLLSGLLLTAVCTLQAQNFLTLPEVSQKASAMQRIGLTDIKIEYHRPLAGGRKVWGGLVPYDQVWRAGANENTTIEFSGPVKVEGQPLAKGIYGLHMIPGTDSWTVIFSKMSNAWGSFSYDKAEDALRVTVKPQAGEQHEALTYDFDNPKPDSVVVKLQWEKLAVPFQVSADEVSATLASLREELRGGKQYTWTGFAEAGDYCLTHNVALEEGLVWANKSIASEERFENVMLKAGLLKALNKTTEAGAARDRAMTIGTPQQIYVYGRQKQAEKDQKQAMDVFRIVVKRFPDHWVSHLAAGRLASAAGDYAAAAKEIRIALTGDISEAQKTGFAGLIKRLEAGQDIN